MSLALSAISLTALLTILPFSSTPIAQPSLVQLPICLNTREGEWIPNILFVVLTIPLTTFEMVFIASSDLIPFINPFIMSLPICKNLLGKSLTALIMFVDIDLTRFTTVVPKFLKRLAILVAIPLTVLGIDEANDLKVLAIVVHFVLIKLIAVLERFIKIVRIPPKKLNESTPIITSIAPLNICLTPSHMPLKSPVNKALNVLTTPIMISSAPVITFLIAVHT